jgi:ABC-type multidrug transport system fused ATPase/permease subunit/aminoglycoside phosphotransferase (APT) family kinase protein
MKTQPVRTTTRSAAKGRPGRRAAPKKAAPKKAAPNKKVDDKHGLSDLKLTIRLIRHYSVGQRRTFLIAGGLLVFEAGTAILEAGPLAYLIDFLRQDNKPLDLPFVGSGFIATIAALTLAILLIAMINSAADSGVEMFLARGGQTLGYQLRVALFGHLQRLSLAYHDRKRTGDVITRVTSDVKEVEEFVTDSLSDIAGSLLLLVGIIGFLFSQSWHVTALALLMIPIMALISNFFSKRIKVASKRQRAREGDLASTTQEMLTSIRVVQTFGRGGDGEKRFARHSSKFMDAAMETARLEAWFSWIWSVLKALTIGAVVWIGVWLLDRDAGLSLGVLVWLVILIEEMFKPTRKIIKQWNKIGKLYASVERIADVLNREATVADLPGARPAPPLTGKVEFRNVTFRYQLDPEDAAGVVVGEGRKEALKSVSFKASPGEVVALVGHSGAGKTSIAQLLPRLYDPQEGRVLLDGQDVRSFTLESLRSQISMVLQETVLFSGTVADNISYGRPEATREEVVEAAMRANAHEFILQMPDGYDTELSERATNLSGGQRQRIAVARAIIRGAPLLILDEPTTGMDAESTGLVLRGLRTLMRGKTTLLISHDLNLIRSADHILVLQGGAIVQSGSHEELLVEGGVYAHLYSKQFEETGHGAPAQTPGARRAPAGPPQRSEAPAAAEELARAVSAPSEPSDGNLGAAEVESQRAIADRFDEDFDRILGEVRGMAATLREKGAAAISSLDWKAEGANGEVSEDADGTVSEVSRAGVSEAGNGRGPEAAERDSLVPPSGLPDPPANGHRSPAMEALADGHLHRYLPGLDVVMDARRMLPVLQSALFGGVWGEFEVERCTPGKATYLSPEACVVRYAVGLRERAGDRRVAVTVGGRLFRDRAASASFLEHRVAPLARALDHRPELAAFTSSTARLESPPMVLFAWPIDVDLPTLPEASDPEHVLGLFRSHRHLIAATGLTPESCRVTLAHYPRRDHCVLRYDLEGPSAGVDGGQAVLYGKLGSTSLRATHDVLSALHEAVANAGGAVHLRVPRPVAFLPELNLSLVEALPGSAGLRELIKARVRGAPVEDDSVSLEYAIDAGARAAAALHGIDEYIGPVRTLHDDLQSLRPTLEVMQRVTPELATQLEGHRTDLLRLAETTESMSLRLSHGDFTPSQLVLDRSGVGLLDFDGACRAEPALDLGEFCAYLRVKCRRSDRHVSRTGGRLADELCERFLLVYESAALTGDAQLLRSRVRLFEAYFLLRIAARSWQQLKGSRALIALTVLEERLAWAASPRA